MTGAPRILVIEDDAEAREAMADVLGDAGYQVTEAGGGRIALQLAAAVLPDLVLLDLILPDAAGFTLLGELRALPGASALPVVAVSGFPERADDAVAANECFDAYLQKPFSSAALLKVVAGALGLAPA